MRRLTMFGGLLLALGGACMILMLYGFGTMADPAIHGVARQAAIWRSVVRDPLFSFGVLTMIGGVWLMFQKPRRAARAAAVR